MNDSAKKKALMRLLVIAYPKSGTTGILRILRDVTDGTLQDNLRFGRGNKSLSLGSPNIEIFKDHSSLGPYLKEKLDFIVIGTRSISSIIESSIHFFEPEVHIFGKNLSNVPILGTWIARILGQCLYKFGGERRHIERIKKSILGMSGSKYKSSEYLRNSYKDYLSTLRQELTNSNFSFCIVDFDSWKENPISLIQSLNAWLDIDLSQKQLEKIAQNSTFEKHKKRFQSEEQGGRYFKTRNRQMVAVFDSDESAHLANIEDLINREINQIKELKNCIGSL